MRSLKIQSLIVLCATVLLSILPLEAQQPSPPGSAEITVDGKKIAISYHRPSMKGRKIFGELVPYTHSKKRLCNGGVPSRNEILKTGDRTEGLLRETGQPLTH